LGDLEVDPAPVDAGVGDLDTVDAQFGGLPFRNKVGATSEHVLVRPPLRLAEVALATVNAVK